MPKEKERSPNTQRKEAVGEADAPKYSGNGSHEIHSIFDLHTTLGQVSFILIIAAIAVLVQILPQEFLPHIGRDEIDKLQEGKCVRDDNGVGRVGRVEPTGMPSYIIYNPRSESDDHLVHVKSVLERLGFQLSRNDSDDWDLMWAHEYPFFKLPHLREVQEHQIVNHLPGSGFITNKVDLALTNSKYIPKAFRLPGDAEKFQEYAREFPDKQFVQKNNKHRHIYLKTIPEIDISDNETFIQEYMANPLLVDGKKFDIGAYVVVTSVDPLRIYVYRGDYLLRFCPVDYYPFDRTNLDKYVVGDDYTPIWEMESLKEFHSTLVFGMRDSLDAHLRSVGKDSSVIWDQIHDSITEILLLKENLLVEVLKRFKHRRNFFELMRFDFIVDENLRVFLLEANMSPNLSSAHFKPNQLLYEQVIYNMFKLVGIGSVLRRESLRKRDFHTEAMMSSFKNIAVDANICASESCKMSSCSEPDCRFCRWCLTKDDLAVLHAAYREHTNRGDMLRIFPISGHEPLSPRNLFMSQWFDKKCQEESSWC